MVTDEVAGVVYLLKDSAGRVLECRGDLELMLHPVIRPQIEPLITSGGLTWQPYSNLIAMVGRRVSVLEPEPLPPS